ncbi:MAG: hypothetical protein K2P79_06305 [Sphingomonas sp.]|nr:hypothetical protein [Sphingomonas sp.]
MTSPVVWQEPEVALAIADARIDWALNHPHTSDWLKAALLAAQGLDPMALQNDVEMLRHLISQRATAQIEIAMNHVTTGLNALSLHDLHQE